MTVEKTITSVFYICVLHRQRSLRRTVVRLTHTASHALICSISLRPQTW
jgi:hypothetical protein